VAGPAWRSYLGRSLTVYAPAGSAAGHQAPTVLRIAERALARLTTLLQPSGAAPAARIALILIDSLDQYQPPSSAAAETGPDGAGPPTAGPPIILGGGPPTSSGALVVAPLTRLCVARWCGAPALEAGAILSGLVGLIAAEVETGNAVAAADAWVQARLAAQTTITLTAHPAATSFVAFLVRTLGAEALRAFLTAYDPARRDHAALLAYGRPLHTLEAAWLAGLRRTPTAAWRVFFRQIRPLVHPGPRVTLEIGVCLLIGLGVTLLLPLAGQYILDTVLPAHDLALLGWCSVGLFLAYVVNTVTDQRRLYLGADLTQDSLIGLQERLFAHLQRLSPAFYTQAQTGDLAARFTSDSTIVQQAVDGVINSGIPMALTALVVAGLLVVLNGALAALLLILIPPFALAYQRLRSRLDQALYTQQHLDGTLQAGIQESLAGQTVIRAFRMQARIFRAYRVQVAQIDHIDAAVRVLGGRFSTSTGVVLAAGQILVLGVGGSLVIQNQLTLGTLVAFLGLVPSLFTPIAALSDVGRQIQQAAGALDRITELLHQAVTIRDSPEARDLPPLATAIHCEHLSFGYTPHDPLLQDVELLIPARSQVAVVGPSGAGKSTLAYLLLRLWDPTAGRVLFDGQDIRQATQASLHGQIGIVFQDTFLFNTTIRENIALGRPEISDAAVAAAAGAAQLDRFIAGLPLGYDTVVGERGVRMSGGQRQRLAIARALAGNPAVLIFDEATSALDAQTERELQEVLAQVARGRTTIVITHRLAQAAAADQIIVLDGGRVVEQGRHGDLMRQAGLYRRLFEEQAGYVDPAGRLRLRTAAARLRAIPLFADLTGAELNTLAEELDREAYATSADVVRQGEPGDRLYLIQRGAATVLIRDHQTEREIAWLADGDYFGEGSLLAGGVRTATVRTTEPTEFYTLTRANFTALADRVPAIRVAVETVLQTRRANRLRLIPLFAGLDLADLLALGAVLQSVSFPAGVDVVRQGEPGDTLYLIGRGRAVVLVAARAVEQEVDQMTDGDYFGEFALFSGGTRTATVRTTEPTEFYTLSHTRFAALLAQEPAIRAAVETARIARWTTRLPLIPLFAGLPSTTQAAVAAALYWQRRAAGETLVHQGESGTTLYVFQQGAAEGITVTPEGERRVDLLAAGDYFGAAVVLDGTPYAATVQTTAPAELFCLDRAAVQALLIQSPELQARLRESADQVSGPSSQLPGAARSSP